MWNSTNSNAPATAAVKTDAKHAQSCGTINMTNTDPSDDGRVNESSLTSGARPIANGSDCLGGTNSGTSLASILAGVSIMAAALVLILLLPIAAQAQAPNIISISPTTNAYAVARDAEFIVTFDREMDVNSVTTSTIPTSSNIAIYGSQSGYISANAAVKFESGSTQMRVRVAQMFKPGERIDITLRGAKSSTGIVMAKTNVSQFTAESVSGGTLSFSRVQFGHGANNVNSREVKLGDLDGDGDIDVVVGNLNAQDEVWLNDGAGNFTTSLLTSPSAQRHTRGMGLGDMDGDGDLDIVMSIYQSYNLIYFNNGDGTFTYDLFGRYNSENTGISIGDIDGDGDLDVVSLSENLDYDDTFFNNGDGTFKGVNGGRTRCQNQTRLVDYELDGDLDMFQIGRLWQSHRMYNRGDGVFQWGNIGGPTFNNGGYYHLRLFDTNGDGVPERTFITYRYNHADLDNDGDVDYVSNQGGGRLNVNDGSGTFSSSQITGVATFNSIDFGDLDGDGDLDAVAVRNGTNYILTNNLATVQLAVTPSAAEGAEPRDSDITVSYNQAMSSASVTPINTSVFVHGSLSGRVTVASMSLSNGDKTLTVNPAADFLPGELVSISSTGGEAQSGTPIENTIVSQFHAAVLGGSGELSDGDALGNGGNVTTGDFDGDGRAEFLLIDDAEVYLVDVAMDQSWTTSAVGIAPGNAAHAIAADFDGDGDLDALLERRNAFPKLLMNDGSGVFSIEEAELEEGVASTITDFAVGDLDGDGDIDVLAAAVEGLFFYENFGGGSFAKTELIGDRYSAVEIADFNNDGVLDAVAARRNFPDDRPLQLWLGNGDGTFNVCDIAIAQYHDLAVADLDGNGFPDIVAGTDTNFQSEIYLNQGNAVFNKTLVGNTGNGSGVGIADMDGDFDLDVVILSTAQTNLILFNNGAGSFGEVAQAFLGARRPALADFDGDGDIDLAASNAVTGTLFFNIDPLPQVLQIAPAKFSNEVALNSDIDLTYRELAETNALELSTALDFKNLTLQGAQGGHRTPGAGLSITATSNTVHINPSSDFFPGEQLIVSATGATNAFGQAQTPQVFNMRAAVPAGTGGLYPQNYGPNFLKNVAIGDLNADGDLDALVLVDGAPAYAWLNQGDGTFNQTLFGAGQYNAVALGDLDGDGDLDAALANSNSAQAEVWMNNGSGSFSMTQFGAGTGRTSNDVAINDLDGDGDLDVIWAGSNAVLIGRNNGSGIPAISILAAGAPTNLALGDINCDDAVDIVVTYGSGGSKVFLNNANDGSFTETSLESAEAHSVALGDLNSDGKLDALLAGASGTNASIETWIGDGSGGFVTSATVVHAAVNDIELGDLNADGFLDVFVCTDQADAIWLNKGDASFTRRQRDIGASYGAAMGDIDSDGALEIIVAHSGFERIWQNLAAPTISSMFPTSATVTTGSLTLNLTGTDILLTGATIETVNSSGAVVGSAALTIDLAELTNAQITIPAGLAATAASLTLIFDTDGGQTTNVLTLNNDQPQIATIQTVVTTNEDTPLKLSMSLNDVWPGVSKLVITAATIDITTIASIVQLGATGATTQFLVTPAQNVNFNGQALTFEAFDGQYTVSTTFTLDVVPVNDEPQLAAATSNVLTDEDITTTLTLALADVDTPMNQLILTATSSNPALITSAGLSFGATAASTQIMMTPILNAFGSALITVSVFDGEFTTSTSFTLDVTPVNDPPSVVAFATNLTADEDETTQTNIQILDPETAYNALNISVTSSNQALFTQASFNLLYLNPQRVLSISPLPNANGSAVVTVSVSDGEFTRTTTIQVTVLPVDDVPTIEVSEPIVQTLEDTSTSVTISLWDETPFTALTLSAVSSNPALIENSGITFGVTGATTTVMFAPVTNANSSSNGNATIEIFVNDGILSGSTTFTFTVQAQNDPHSLLAEATLFGTQNKMISTQINIIDVDHNFAATIVSATSSNQALFRDENLMFSSTGASTHFKLTPECEATGTALITILATDGEFEARTTISVTLQAIDALSISGATCACLDVALSYQAEPRNTAATHVWTIVGGTILSGQGSDEVQVAWQQGSTITSLTVQRTSLIGCVNTTTSQITGKAAQALNDYLLVTNGSASLDLLANDQGAGLQLLQVDSPQNGQTSIVGSTLTYTPDPGFSGQETLQYSMQSIDNCIATSAVLIVTPATQSPLVNGEYVEQRKNRSGTVRGLSRAYGSAVSPNGKYVYVAGRNDHSIAIFERNQTSGSLTYISRVRNGRNSIVGLKYPSALAMDPAGKYLYAAGYGDNSLVILECNPSTGLLTFSERKRRGQVDGSLTIGGLKRPRMVETSSDGRSIFVTAMDDHSVAVFNKDVFTGDVSYVGCFKDGSGGVDGLRQALGLDVSPDGAHVYVAGMGEDAIAMFTRDVSTGALSYSQCFRNGLNGVSGLDGVYDVTVSPDGLHVYAAGYYDDAIVVFSRNALDGALTFVKKYSDGTTGFNGLNGISNIAVSPDGAQVWVTAVIDDAVTLLRRKANNGHLIPAGVYKDGQNGVNGLNGARFAALSSDGEFAYVVGTLDDAVAVLQRNYKPLAEDDVVASVAKNAATQILALSNDLDTDGHILSIISKTDPALGTVTIGGGGSELNYAAGNTTGADQFTYTVSDGHGGESTATVSLTVVQARGMAPGTNPADAAKEHLLTMQPNPVPGGTLAEISVNLDVAFTVRILDLRGRTVATLSRAASQTGAQQMQWPALNRDGSALAAGVYSLVLEYQDIEGQVRHERQQTVILR